MHALVRHALHTQESGGLLCLPRERVDAEVLNAAGAGLNDALTNPFFGML